MAKVIYGIIDPLSNQLRYIGQTTNFSKRKSAHYRAALNKSNNSHVYNWIRDLWSKSVEPEFIIIEEVAVSELDYWEIFYIDYFRSIGCELTNICVGGNSKRGYNHTEETKSKMAVLMKGNNWNTGKTLTKEHCDNIGAAHLGKKRSEQAKQNMRKPKERALPVIQLDKSDNIIKVWDSVYEAYHALGISRSSINNVLTVELRLGENLNGKELIN